MRKHIEDAAPRPADRASELRCELARRIASLIGSAENCTTDIPGLSLHQRTAPTDPCPATYEPSVTVIAQGRKQVELGHLTQEQKRSYLIADNKIAQNGLRNEEFLRLELTDLKESGANLELLGFNPMETADITLGKDVEFKEYDESAADDVEMLTCPKCGHAFPK